MQSHIPFLAYQRGDVQRNLENLNITVAQATKVYEEGVTKLQGQQKTMETIITATREAAAKVGVAHFTTDFRTESDSQATSAKKWLWTTVVMAILTVLASVGVFFVPLEHDAKAAQVLQLFTSKVVILGLLFTATIWCGKLYKAAIYQVLVNRHRANALLTFQAFTQAASDNAVRDSVLLETTRSIFAITQSGYLDNESTPEGGKVVEVVRNLAQTVATATK